MFKYALSFQYSVIRDMYDTISNDNNHASSLLYALFSKEKNVNMQTS